MKFFRLFALKFLLSLVLVLIFQLPSIAAGGAIISTRTFNPATWYWLVDFITGDDDNPSPTNYQEILPDILESKFPFDLIYPVTPVNTIGDDQCLSTTLWGKTRQFCAPMQITRIAKDLVLLRWSIQAILSL